ncbi:MAG TPA: hypothetical protein DDW50_16740, partial [Firmicutes bacterium]|nr:hypothetical protein [Bacillota bacterium]
EKLRDGEEKFRLLFENMTNGFALHEVVCNDQGKSVDFRFLLVNKAYEIMMHLSKEEIVGKTALEINPSIEEELIHQYCEVGLTGKPLQMEYWSKEFNKYFKVFAFSPPRGEFATVYEDTTESKIMQNALQESERRLNLATSSAEIGLWDIQLQTQEIYFNEQWAQSLGYSLAEISPVSLAIWRNLTHPEDLEIAEQNINKHLAKETVIYECPMRMKHKDGWVWMLDRGKVVSWDENGKPIRMIGTHIDISRQKAVEEELRRSEERFKQLAELFPETIFESDLSGNFTYANQHAFTRFGFAPEDLFAGVNIVNLAIPRDKEHLINYLQQRVLNNDSGYIEYTAMDGDGKEFPVLGFTALIIYNSVPVGLRGFILDITERKQSELELIRAKEMAKLPML